MFTSCFQLDELEHKLLRRWDGPKASLRLCLTLEGNTPSWLLGSRVIPETSMDLMRERRSTHMERVQGWEGKEGALTQKNLEPGKLGLVQSKNSQGCWCAL